jgi:serine protease Do
MRRSASNTIFARLCFLAALAFCASPAPAAAQAEPDLGAMLQNAEKYTIKLRATVNWPIPPDSFGTGRGTGFVIDKARGWILTNAHVVRRSPALVEIAFGEDDWQPLERVYVDNVLDVAIVRIAPEKLPPDTTEARLGCGMPLKQGAGVVAYGHPANLAFTATRGIVSSVRMFGHEEYIQLDAQLNPGNSGGPLLSLQNAEVLGINTSSMAGLPGLGFATPIRHVCPIIDLLKEGRDPTQPLLPAYWLKSGRNETLTVARVFPNHEDAAALKPGDVVTGIAGERRAQDHADLMTQLRGRSGAVRLALTRDGAALEASVPVLSPQPVMERRALTLAGMLIVERNGLDIDYRDEPRLRVEFVRQGDEASRRGVQQWDQVETVGGQSFASLAALHEWLKGRPANERLSVMLKRGMGITSRRVGSEFHRFELRNAEVRLLTMQE